jgi:N12 class adenine-specific DNA methylase
MTDRQIDFLRSIIQDEIYSIVEAQKVDRPFDVGEKRLNHMWDAFKRTFLK